MMRRSVRTGSVPPPSAERQAAPGSRRDRLALLLALVTGVCLGSAFVLSKGTQVLMPGQLSSAHGAIENCSACHTKSGSGKLSWIHGLVAGDPLADSEACLTCHKMPDTAFNAHSASAEVLKQSTERLTRIAARTPAPRSARAQSIAFPTHDLVARGLYCATCHQEHQGVSFDLSKISNEQCRSCHVVKFDSFDRNHPKFENYPFKRRTQIIYDHAGHFGKHYPELAKKDPAKRIPDTCSTCHSSREDRRVMAVAPFDKTCTTCHLDQIIGKERASGPKGIAFLTVPSIDLQTLKKKNASIGEWPEASEAALTPFMKVMIGRDERGRALIKTVDRLDLQDLTGASNEQIKAVTDVVWEIKGLFYALIKGKASDVLGDLNIASGAKLSASLVADLTASIPRDVVISAHQEWLPSLAAEMAGREGWRGQKPNGWSAAVTGKNSAGSASPKARSGSDARPAAPAPGPQPNSEASGQEQSDSTSTLTESEGSAPAEEPSGSEAADSESASRPKLDPPVCIASVLGQCLLFKGQEDEAQTGQSKGTAGPSESADAKSDGGSKAPVASELPGAMRAGVRDGEQAAEPKGAAGKTADTNSDGGEKALSFDEKPLGKSGDQSDDLLFPTEEELREMDARSKDDDKAVQTGKTAPAAAPTGASAASDAEAAEAQTRAAPVISIESDVDPESWAEYGGWYRQDYAIFYRPTGHKDKLIYSWLFLTGPQAPIGDKSPAAAVFDYLTSKDAQGSCTKCHSVDDIGGKGRVVNFSLPSVKSKQGRFTNFIHEPHFGIMEDRGCLTCHSLEKGRPYLKSYEQGNPQTFVSNFGAVKKDLCQTCHTTSMARQDCLLCHKYHVKGVVTPIMETKIPGQ
jgi:hypothetical protein